MEDSKGSESKSGSNIPGKGSESKSGSNIPGKGSANASGELITWYLARLRNNARQSTLDRRLTPLTLVETDRTLIQEIVMRSHGGYEQRCAESQKFIRQMNKGIHSSQTILLTIGILGSAFLLILVFF